MKKSEDYLIVSICRYTRMDNTNIKILINIILIRSEMQEA